MIVRSCMVRPEKVVRQENGVNRPGAPDRAVSRDCMPHVTHL